MRTRLQIAHDKRIELVDQIIELDAMRQVMDDPALGDTLAEAESEYNALLVEIGKLYYYDIGGASIEDWIDRVRDYYRLRPYSEMAS